VLRHRAQRALVLRRGQHEWRAGLQPGELVGRQLQLLGELRDRVLLACVLVEQRLELIARQRELVVVRCLRWLSRRLLHRVIPR
jgi:hypothetical protein